jgi:hypothetical protein
MVPRDPTRGPNHAGRAYGDSHEEERIENSQNRECGDEIGEHAVSLYRGSGGGYSPKLGSGKAHMLGVSCENPVSQGIGDKQSASQVQPVRMLCGTCEKPDIACV